MIKLKKCQELFSRKAVQIIRAGHVDGAKNVANRIALQTGVQISRGFFFNKSLLVHGVFSKSAIFHLWLFVFNRIYLMPHGQLAIENIRRSLKKQVAAISLLPLLPFCTFVFLSEDERRRCFIKPIRYLLLPNFVNASDLGLIEPVSPSFDASKPITLVFWGRLDVHHKGLDRFLRFAALAHERNFITKVIMIGPRKDEQSDLVLEGLDAALGSAFHHIDFIERKELFHVVPRNAVFCLFSRHEGMPLAALEAMILGLPVVATSETNLFCDFKGLIVNGDQYEDVSFVLTQLSDSDINEKVRMTQNIIHTKEVEFFENFKRIRK